MNFLKRIVSFVYGVFEAFVFFTLGVLGVYTALVIFTSGYEYRLVNNRVQRAWHVQLPGYEQYLDFNSKPPAYRERFTMRKYYRVGPWFEPEYPQDETTNAKL